MARKNIKASDFLPQIPQIILKKKRLQYDPATIPEKRTTPVEAEYSVYNYDKNNLEEHHSKTRLEWDKASGEDKTTWINADGLRKVEIEELCKTFNVHPLLIEDILSIGQRAKMDEVDCRLFCLLPMVFFNKENSSIEIEQVSIVVGDGIVLSFQEDASRDVFDPLRSRLRNPNMRIREKEADYLCYALLDVIVDSYFGVIEKLSDRIDRIEDKIMSNRTNNVFAEISYIRKEVMLMKRSIAPVRDLVNGFLRTDNSIVKEINEKYFKDVSDHIIQAHDTCENLRDMLGNLQDMYMNRMNLKMNEVMKIFTMVSLLLAPATIIGGIFGMNFDRIPLLHDQRGFYISVALMLAIPLIMLIFFRKKKWL